MDNLCTATNCGLYGVKKSTMSPFQEVIFLLIGFIHMRQPKHKFQKPQPHFPTWPWLQELTHKTPLLNNQNKKTEPDLQQKSTLSNGQETNRLSLACTQRASDWTSNNGLFYSSLRLFTWPVFKNTTIFTTSLSTQSSSNSTHFKNFWFQGFWGIVVIEVYKVI